MQTRFIAEGNVGKLARWLRMIGYDTLLFEEKNDEKMIDISIRERRVILTKNAEIMKRRVVADGKVQTVHVKDDDPKAQLRETVRTLNLDYHFKPFSLCLECNQTLVPRGKEGVRYLVPRHVSETQEEYVECPLCHRIYWHGTHWQAMVRELNNLAQGN